MSSKHFPANTTNPTSRKRHHGGETSAFRQRFMPGPIIVEQDVGSSPEGRPTTTVAYSPRVRAIDPITGTVTRKYPSSALRTEIEQAWMVKLLQNPVEKGTKSWQSVLQDVADGILERSSEDELHDDWGKQSTTTNQVGDSRAFGFEWLADERVSKYLIDTDRGWIVMPIEEESLANVEVTKDTLADTITVKIPIYASVEHRFKEESGTLGWESLSSICEEMTDLQRERMCKDIKGYMDLLHDAADGSKKDVTGLDQQLSKDYHLALAARHEDSIHPLSTSEDGLQAYNRDSIDHRILMPDGTTLVLSYQGLVYDTPQGRMPGLFITE